MRRERVRKGTWMNLKCKLGYHQWVGCACTGCGQRRPHVWTNKQDACTQCGSMIEIATLAQLQAINNDLDGHYRLVSDIDASETKEWNAGNGFTPIGADSQFRGILDGGGHVVNRLHVDQSVIAGAGLVARNCGLIRNVHLKEAYIASAGVEVGGIAGCNERGTVGGCSTEGQFIGILSVGGVVGKNEGKVTNCKSAGYVGALGIAGGIAGTNERNGEIADSASSCRVCLSPVDLPPIFAKTLEGKYAGGAVGWNRNNGDIARCVAFGKVEGVTCVGGLVGSHQGYIAASSAFGDVSGQENVGGLVGETINRNSGTSTIRNCSALGAVTGHKIVGGLVGVNKCDIETSFAAGKVSGQEFCGGLIGWADKGSIVDCYCVSNSGGQPVSALGLSLESQGKTSAEMMRQSTFPGWDFEKTWQIVEDHAYPDLRCLALKG